MNYLEKKTSKIKKVWKQVALLGVWIGTITGSILIPLPEWGDGVQHSSQIKFILFISTVVAGFSLILFYKLKNKLSCLIISISVFIILIGSYYYYNHNITCRTMKYSDSIIVIGSELKDPNHYKSLKEQYYIDDDKILMTVGGDPTRIWTERSIRRNKGILIFLLSINYCVFAIFLVSFTSTINLYTSKNE